MQQIVEGIAAAHGARATLQYKRGYPATVNQPEQSDTAARAAAEVVGEANVDRDPMPNIGAEDFAFMLQAKPGAYIWLGNGPGAGGCMLHNPRYDFNDQALNIGASYWARLVEAVLK